MTGKPRFGLDCRKILDPKNKQKAGIAYYIYNLTKALLEHDQQHEYTLIFDAQASNELLAELAKLRPDARLHRLLPQSWKIPGWSEHLGISRQLAKLDLDFCIFPANVIPLGYQGKCGVIVHDLAIYWHPEWFPEHQFLATKYLVPRSLKRADLILAVSENTKQDIIKRFKIPAEKIKVLYPVIEAQPLAEQCSLQKYFCFVGTIEPRKNIANLLKAFSQFINSDAKYLDYRLKLAGDKGWKSAEIFQQLNNTAAVEYLGYVNEDSKKLLMANSQALVFPSFYEGFGMPVVEAQLLGVPVICSNNSSLPEAAGQAGLLVDPQQVDEIAQAMKKIADNPGLRSELAAAGKQNARRFTSQQIVRDFLACLT